MKKLIYGVGFNDSGITVSRKENGKQVWICPIYACWKHMLERCYDVKAQKNNPAYIGCTVSPEWFSFSSFRSWAILQNWQGNEIDKDILVFGNREYSKEKCVFVSKKINAFMKDIAAADRGKITGVSFRHRNQKFQARCANPETGKRESLGLFYSYHDACYAWACKKLEHAHWVAKNQSDWVVALRIVSECQKLKNHALSLIS